MQLLIMAAGMGSRFGGLKQIEPMGPNEEFIIDYSIYDAKKAGFNKVIFIIKEENYQIFKETIGSRVDRNIEVEYVFQKMDNIPDFVKIPEDRTKPYVVNIESLGEENVIKMNNIMTKAGKHDNNIKQAYDHIVFNKSKYI